MHRPELFALTSIRLPYSCARMPVHTGPVSTHRRLIEHDYLSRRSKNRGWKSISRIFFAGSSLEFARVGDTFDADGAGYLSPLQGQGDLPLTSRKQALQQPWCSVFAIRDGRSRLSDQAGNQRTGSSRLTRRYEEISLLPNAADRAMRPESHGANQHRDSRGHVEICLRSRRRAQAPRIRTLNETILRRPLTPLHAGHVGWARERSCSRVFGSETNVTSLTGSDKVVANGGKCDYGNDIR